MYDKGMVRDQARVGTRRDGRATVWVVVALVVVVSVASVAVFSRWIDNESELGPTVKQITDEKLLVRFTEDLNEAVLDERSAAVTVLDLTAFVEKFPENDAGWRALGQAKAYEEDPQGAYEAFTRSLELRPNQPEIAILAGTFAKGLERFEASERWYRKAIEQQPRVVGHRRHLAILYEHRGDLPMAEQTLREALALAPNHVELLIQLASIIEAAGREDEALSLLEHAVTRSVLMSADRRRLLAIRYADMMLSRGQPQRAQEALEPLPASQQFRHDVLERLAICWGIAGEPQRAAERYDTKLILDPEDQLAASEAVRWWIMAGRVDKAKASLTRLRRIAPRHEKLSEFTEQIEALSP